MAMPKVKNRSTLSIPTEVSRKARGRAISEGKSLSAVVTTLLRMWLADEVELPEPEAKPETKRKKRDKPIE